MLHLDLFIGRDLDTQEKLKWIDFFAKMARKYGRHIDISLKGGIGTEYRGH